MGEVPWPPGPQPCLVELHPGKDGHLDGWLTFISPKTGRNESLAITTGPPRDDEVPVYGQRGKTSTLKRWHWHDNGDGTGYTEPSIHLPDEYHSPFRTPWRLSPANPDGTWPATQNPATTPDTQGGPP